MAYNQGPRPTKLPDCMGYRAWSALRTCFNFPLFMATGQAKNRHVEFPTSFQTKPDFVPVRFSQSELLPMSSDGTVASYFIIYWGLSCIRTLWTFEQGRWKHSSHWISRWINQFFPVWFYWNVFCTWDAFHNRNSQCCFWASVSFLLCTPSWQEPFGESFSRLTIDSKMMSEFTLLN